MNRHPEASLEIIKAAEYFERRQAGLGERFLGALQEAIDKIAFNPDTGILHDHGTKLLRLKGFPWGVIYLEFGEVVYIVAVSDLRRRPGYWVDRLEDLS